MSAPARERYALRIIPAGRDDRVAEIADARGNIIRLIYCPRSLANSLETELDDIIRQDWETMDATAFAVKYGLPGEK